MSSASTHGTTRALATALSLALSLGLAACGADDSSGDSGESGGGALTVLAAASLTDVFEEMADGFEAANDAEVRFSFGSSTDLAEQADAGAPGDVLATADETAMSIATDAGVTADAETFATNVIVIVTRPGNPTGITSPADLEGVDWVRCADEVPCGRVALSVLEAGGVDAEPVSLEEDVRATLDKVTSGEVDAGLVYATDAVAAGDDVERVDIEAAAALPTTYAIAVLEQAEDPDLAQAWVDYVTSDEGQDILADAGFDGP